MSRPDLAPPPGAALGNPPAFIRAQTAPAPAPLVPEIELYLASELVPRWQLTESELAATGLPPPFWAFAWAGGQALARYILDHPGIVSGKRVLDFGAGSGIVGIAAAKAGAAHVTAADIDPMAAAATVLNAGHNGVAVTVTTEDLTTSPARAWNVILAGDVCYEQPAADRITAWLKDAARHGAQVLIGDPGRSFLPKAKLTEIDVYQVQTTRELEDSDVRRTAVWRLNTGKDRAA